jgi:PhnB protein
MMGHTIMAYLCVDGAAEAIAFYTKAFGAKERYRFPMEDGSIGHCEMEIGNSVIALSDEAPELNVVSPKKQSGHSLSIVMDVEDVDAVWQQALDAGAEVERPLKDEPYGRAGWIIDPFGHRWSIMRTNPSFDPASMGMELPA